jgi:hypothetical protein
LQFCRALCSIHNHNHQISSLPPFILKLSKLYFFPNLLCHNLILTEPAITENQLINQSPPSVPIILTPPASPYPAPPSLEAAAGYGTITATSCSPPPPSNLQINITTSPEIQISTAIHKESSKTINHQCTQLIATNTQSC